MGKGISFGAWLYKKRRTSDLTRKALAARVGCAEITLRRIENGTLKPSKELALILLDQLGIPNNDRLHWVQFARGRKGCPEQPVGSSRTRPRTQAPSPRKTLVGSERERAEIIKRLNKYHQFNLTGKTKLSIKFSEAIAELAKLAEEMREAQRRGESLNLTEDEIAFYDALEVNDSVVQKLGDDTLKAIARELVDTVRKNMAGGWTVRNTVRANLRVKIRKILKKHGYPPGKQEKAIRAVLVQAEVIAKDRAG